MAENLNGGSPLQVEDVEVDGVLTPISIMSRLILTDELGLTKIVRK